MSRTRIFFVPFEKPGSVEIGYTGELSIEDSRHARDVLRLKQDDTITCICSDTGHRFMAKVLQHTQITTFQICSEGILDTPQLPTISLLMALCKGKKNDIICEKAVELGVSHIVFWQAKRSVARFSSTKDQSTKIARWHKIAESAAKQSHRTSIPDLVTHPSLEGLLEYAESNSEGKPLKLVCSLSKDAMLMKECTSPTHEVQIVIGPEGGLTEHEEEIFSQQGFQAVRLSPYVLRSETAAITALAQLQITLPWEQKQ